MPTPILFTLSRRRPALLAMLSLLWVVSASQSLLGQGSQLLWQPLQAPATPQTAEAIAGGGSTAPAFVCHAKDGSGTYPGQWVKGGCAIAHDGQALTKSDFEVAYGSASWGQYDSRAPGILQTGSSAGGSPLFSCRVQYRGYQVGVIIDNKCAFAIDGRYIAQRAPFEALYAPGSAPIAPAQAATPPPASPRRQNRDDLSALAPGGQTPGTPANSCLREVGKAQSKLMVKQCLQVSPATRPPCNSDNSCSLIRDEIRRGCKLLANRAPDFCDDYR